MHRERFFAGIPDAKRNHQRDYKTNGANFQRDTDAVRHNIGYQRPEDAD
ncbi:hypothetical protein SDC9_171170 [bioreactor metagenome]|uniref:Uncharacterized protein n=1 Tax=bioreactor metagenome TaxID=1076179 RepID=A0A645GA40_9ZZZZ